MNARTCWLLIAAAAAAIGACSGDGEPSGDDVDDGRAGVPIPSVTVPASRGTPFCRTMIDLSDRLETDPPPSGAATTELIIETYESIADDVPDAIAVDFAAVLAGLRGETPDEDDAVATTEPAPPPTGDTVEGEPPEGDAFFEEGYSPDDDPALRVNEYVEFACRDSVNNPGPPPTQPLDEIVLDEVVPDEFDDG